MDDETSHVKNDILHVSDMTVAIKKILKQGGRTYGEFQTAKPIY